jgi:hypothetical protein
LVAVHKTVIAADINRNGLRGRRNRRFNRSFAPFCLCVRRRKQTLNKIAVRCSYIKIYFSFFPPLTVLSGSKSPVKNSMTFFPDRQRNRVETRIQTPLTTPFLLDVVADQPDCHRRPTYGIDLATRRATFQLPASINFLFKLALSFVIIFNQPAFPQKLLYRNRDWF